MKNLLYFALLLFVTACAEKTTNESAVENQQNTTSQTVETASEQETEMPMTSNIGLANYDKSKLVFQPIQVLPVDESKQNKSLRKTLDDLLIVVKNKDIDGLKPFIDQDIRVSFGENEGFNDFINFWNLDLDAETSMLWDVLETTISLGGTFDEQNEQVYYTPYIFTDFPGEYDAFEFGVIVGKEVNIRATPSLKGKLVRQLTHEVVRLIAYDKPFDSRTQTIGKETHDWMKIEMADGKTGYVWGKFFRSPIDYRASFAKVRDEGWKMVFFVAGD